jgi:two-component system, sensor histidine kinase PdtaS
LKQNIGVRTKLVLLVLIISSFSVFGQTDEDFDAWHKTFFELIWTNADSAQIFINRMEDFAAKTKKNKHNAAVNSVKGTYYYALGLNDKALEFYTQAYDFAKKDKDLLLQGKSLFNMGNCHYEEHDFTRAEESYAKALSIFVEIDDKNWILNCKYAKANVLHDSYKYAQALALYEELEKLYLAQNQFIYAGYCNLGVGACNTELGNHEAALHNLNLALQRVDTSNDPFTHAIILNHRVNTYIALNKPTEALFDAKRALELSQGVDYKKQIYKSYWALARAYHANKDWEEAKNYYELTIDYKDTVFNEEKQAQFALNDVRFNTALNLETISLQEALIYQKNRTILALAIAAAILLILLILLIRTFNKLKRNRLQLENSLIEKDALLREIHHRVKNNLQVVSSLLNMHVRKVSDPKSKKILEEGADRVTAMAIIHKNLYQHTDLKTISLDDYLSKLCDQLFANYQAMDAHVALKTDLQPVDVDLDRLIPIGLIVNELISNAMKHAFTETQEAQISVKLSKNAQNQIELEIADNGVGMSADIDMEKSESIGMKLIRIFSQKLNSLVEISGDNGTNVKLCIPM